MKTLVRKGEAMPAPRKLPSNTELLKLREKGHTYDEIADMFGVTQQAVYFRLREAGGTGTRPDHRKYIPWRVKTEHAHCRPATMLRYLSRREQGDTIPPVKERMLDKWLEQLKEADVVVCYDRDVPPNPASPTTGGFYYSKRTPEDGDNLIRVTPEQVDDTSKVPVRDRKS